MTDKCSPVLIGLIVANGLLIITIIVVSILLYKKINQALARVRSTVSGVTDLPRALTGAVKGVQNVVQHYTHKG